MLFIFVSLFPSEYIFVTNILSSGGRKLHPDDEEPSESCLSKCGVTTGSLNKSFRLLNKTSLFTPLSDSSSFESSFLFLSSFDLISRILSAIALTFFRKSNAFSYSSLQELQNAITLKVYNEKKII